MKQSLSRYARYPMFYLTLNHVPPASKKKSMGILGSNKLNAQGPLTHFPGRGCPGVHFIWTVSCIPHVIPLLMPFARNSWGWHYYFKTAKPSPNSEGKGSYYFKTAKPCPNSDCLSGCVRKFFGFNARHSSLYSFFQCCKRVQILALFFLC